MGRSVDTNVYSFKPDYFQFWFLQNKLLLMNYLSLDAAL